MTEKETSYNATGDLSGTSLGAGVSVKKSYDTQCVQSMMGGK